jgi:catecholate siderophore receptor
MDVVLRAFETATAIRVTVSEEGIHDLHSPGVTGLYTPQQALGILLDDTGVTYHFNGNTAVTLRLKSVVTSVKVTADVLGLEGLPKYTEPLRDTPQSITVVPQQVMQDQGVSTLRDALRNVAGISLAAGEGGAQGDNLTIRGFSARNDMFLDGMRDFGSYYRDPFNTEELEVLEGPSSMTFGRGSTGGVVNQETKAPGMGHFISGTMQFGSDLTRRITADVNQPIGQTTAFRLNVMGHDSRVADRDIAENRRFGVAPSIAFGLGRPTRLTLSYLHESADDTPDYGIPWLFNGPAPVNRKNYYGFRDANFLKTGVDIATARAEHDLGKNITLRNQLRFGHYDRNAQITEAQIANAPKLTTPLEDILVNRNQITVRSLETFLSDQLDGTFKFKTGALQHSVVAGVEGGRETSAPKRFNFPFTGPHPVPQTSLPFPNEDQPFAGSGRITSDVHTIAASVGAYVVDTVKIGRHVDVIGGVRWDRFAADYQALNYTYPPTVAATTVTPAHFTSVDNMPSYRGAVVLKPAHDGSVYFAYGTSVNPSAESLSLSVATFRLPPESNRMFEAGSKWDLAARKLSVAGAIFRTDKLNAREPSALDPTLNVLSGKQRVKGAQVSLTSRITDRWQLLSSYAYLDGRLVGSLAFPQFVGAQLANVPRNTFNLWTTYELPWRFTLGGGGQFVDSRTASTTAPLDPTTGLVKRIPGYWVFNAMASHPVNDRINFQVNLYNLANRYYYDEPHPAHIVPGAGFTALAGLNFRF